MLVIIDLYCYYGFSTEPRPAKAVRRGKVLTGVGQVSRCQQLWCRSMRSPLIYFRSVGVMATLNLLGHLWVASSHQCSSQQGPRRVEMPVGGLEAQTRGTFSQH
ncbi:hypothetical protein PoB_000284900 [Plakobranchus ocellatus]|uniref:Uncharacterized protein n=1 Tax=Plakobranchus ocellatus TaxID=259542 RepID=A0AAV3Y2U2_9GAST|nr:hypothetical protein PoB_000284900 [Plakobranchus ocellatus]